MKFALAMLVISLSISLPHVAWAKTDMRLSPGQIKAHLGERTLAFEKNEQGWIIGDAIFANERFHTEWEEGGVGIVTRWDPKIFKPTRVVLMDGQAKAISNTEFSSSLFEIVANGSDPLALQAKEGTPTPGLASVRVPPELVERAQELRFCIEDAREKEKATALVCTPLAQKNSADAEALLVNKKPQTEESGRIPYKKKTDIQWTLKMVTGTTIDVKFKLDPATMHELRLDTGGNLEVRFFSNHPAIDNLPLTPERSWFFQHTIGDMRRFFLVRTPNDVPFVNFQGPYGIRIQQQIKSSGLIQIDSQVTLDDPAPSSTYTSKIKIAGRIPIGYEISPGQKELTVDGENFVWNFSAPKPKAFNVAKIRIQPVGSPNTQLYYDYEIYRSYANYLSVRLGASLTANLGFSGAMDLHAIHWFSDPFGRNSTFSRQRWGVSMGYAQTLLSTNALERYKTSSASLYYRFTPGVDGWNETFGSWLGVMDMQYRETQVQTGFGVGLFWNRSLPNWFNFVLGVVPLFRKPKWVNFSVGYYPLTLKAGSNFQAVEGKAVGRIELSKNTFFEGGWAVVGSAINYRDGAGVVKVTMAAGRGYFGYGYQF